MVIVHLVKIKVQMFAVPCFNVKTSLIVGNGKSFHEMPNRVELRCVAMGTTKFHNINDNAKLWINPKV